MDEKSRSSWSLKAAQAGTPLHPASYLAMSALASLPVLPSALSSANAEPRRFSDPVREDGSAVPAEAGIAVRPLDSVPVVGPREGAPVLASDAQALSQAQARIGDPVAGAEAAQDSPACRGGNTASLDPAQFLPAPAASEDRSGGEGKTMHDAPLPHCLIELDPDADEGDVAAHAPVPQTVQVAAQSAGAQPPAQPQAQPRPGPGVPAEERAASPASDAVPPRASGQVEAALAVAAPASDTPLAVTEAARGLGTAVIDPLVPLDSVVFGSDLLVGFAAGQASPEPALPDPVADAVGLVDQWSGTWLPPGPGLDPFT